MRIRKLIRKLKKVQAVQIDFRHDDALDKFGVYWVPVSEVLVALIDLRLTGAKTDRAIGKLVALGDLIYEGQTDLYPEFVANVREVWDIVSRFLGVVVLIIEAIKVLPRVNEHRADNVIRVIKNTVEVGNWVKG
jgi:hypothetical protein